MVCQGLGKWLGTEGHLRIFPSCQYMHTGEVGALQNLSCKVGGGREKFENLWSKGKADCSLELKHAVRNLGCLMLRVIL